MRTIKEAIDRVTDTLSEKGVQYGPTYRRVALALSVPPQYSILVRMLEKCMRLDNMLTKRRVSDENVMEEFLDIACYAILGMMESSTLNDKEE